MSARWRRAGTKFMQMRQMPMPSGQMVDRFGTRVLSVVAIVAMTFEAVFGLSLAGIDHLLHYHTHIVDPGTGESSVFRPRAHIDLVAIPLAAIAAARLRWGAEWAERIAAPRAIRVRPRWGEESTPPPLASRVRPLLPLLAAAVLFGVFWYWGWWQVNPHYLLWIHPQFGVQRWISVALLAGVGYFGMILSPRLTAAMAGAVAGPALFAVVGYTLFPSFMGAASDLNTITDAEARLAGMLTIVFFWGALAVVIAAALTMLLAERLRQRPLSHAIWVGALTLCLAVSGTHPGR